MQNVKRIEKKKKIILKIYVFVPLFTLLTAK